MTREDLRLTRGQQELIIAYADTYGHGRIMTPASHLAAHFGLTKEYVQEFVRAYNSGQVSGFYIQPKEPVLETAQDSQLPESICDDGSIAV